jgi:PD-(D/E)XK nuclease superfamily protein
MNLIGVKRDNMLSHIEERDIDLLLIEEFLCSREFFYFVANRIEEKKINIHLFEFVKVWHSVSGLGKAKGETDIFVLFGYDNKKYGYFIENKINADFQLNQYKRYVDRAKDYSDKYEFDECQIILFAPKQYLSDKTIEFKKSISYEEIKDFFDNQRKEYDPETLLGRRYFYKIKVIEMAIHKYRRGWEPVACDNTKTFYQKLHQYIQSNYAMFNIKMQNKKDIPGESKFLQILSRELQRNSSIKTILRIKFRPDKKSGFPRIDLELKKLAEHLDQFKTSFQLSLREGMKIKQTGKSISLSIDIKMIDLQGDFNEQLKEIDDALNKVELLHTWFLEHYFEIEKFYKSVGMMN